MVIQEILFEERKGEDYSGGTKHLVEKPQFARNHIGGTPDVATRGCARGKDSPSGRSGTTTLFRSYACVVLPHSS